MGETFMLRRKDNVATGGQLSEKASPPGSVCAIFVVNSPPVRLSQIPHVTARSTYADV